MNYWLLKSEPETYSLDHLKRDKKTPWEGVRNFAARNFMVKMEKGDLCFFYHSGKNAAIVGLGKVVAKAHPDKTQFGKKGHYFEPRATETKPVWFCVDVGYVEKFKNPVSLEEIKVDPKLDGMVLRTHGRLSVQPVSEKQFRYIREELSAL